MGREGLIFGDSFFRSYYSGTRYVNNPLPLAGKNLTSEMNITILVKLVSTCLEFYLIYSIGLWRIVAQVSLMLDVLHTHASNMQ
jgi:hypothetical protein